MAAVPAVIVSRNSRKYHLPGCPGFTQVSAANRAPFTSEAETQAAGCTQAGNCPYDPPGPVSRVSTAERSPAVELSYHGQRGAGANGRYTTDRVS